MNKKDLKAVLLASALGGACFVAPVMAEEATQSILDVTDQITQVNQVADGWPEDGY